MLPRAPVGSLNGNCVMFAPSSLESLFDSSRGKTEIGCPIRQNSRAPIRRDEDVAARVSRLVSTCGPSAIVSAIWAIVVDSLKGVFIGWSLSHVHSERLIGRFPLVRHRDATSSVTRKAIRVFIETPVFRGAPHSVFGRIAHAVLRRSSLRILALTFDTSSRNSLFEMLPIGSVTASAYAYAQPFIELVSWALNKLNNCQLSKLFPIKVQKRHAAILMPYLAYLAVLHMDASA